MIFWALIHTQFYNYLQIRLLQKIDVAPSRRKANVRNSGTQGSPLTWARLSDISGENPDGARFGGSCRRTIDFD